MRKSLSLLFFMILTMVFIKGSSAEPNASKLKPDEVAIHFSGVEMPLNKILLIRKENHYCALKFIHAWVEMDQETLEKFAPEIRQGGVAADSARKAAQKTYATYESYYESDGAPSFTDGSVRREKRTASLLPLQGPFRPFIYQPGNGCVECGPFRLLWQYKTGVSFIPLGKGGSIRDYGIELAPTPWTEMEEVNIKDPRIRWYRYEEERKTVLIPFDKLWGE